MELLIDSYDLQVRESSTRKLVVNMTNPTTPSFYLTGLKPDTGYMVIIVASNAKGYSDRRALQAFTIKSDGLTQLIETNESALATNMDDILPINPFLIVALIVAGVFMSVFLPITIIVCVRKRKRNPRCQSVNQSGTTPPNVTNATRGDLNMQNATSDNNQSNLKLLNSTDDIFSEFEETGSSFSCSGVDQSKKSRREDTTTGPDLIPPYSSISDNGNFLLGKINL